MNLIKGQVAVVITDPQNDFLSPKGVAWGVVGQSVTENNTVANIESLFKAAKSAGVPVFISPHYYYKHDHQWKFEGALEKLMHDINMFDRKGALDLDGFEGSGADWLDLYKPYINDGKTIVTSPHKVFGPESNDLVLQLRKAGINQVILAGMSANLCVESHMRELLEQGFHVVIAADATAAAKLPGLRRLRGRLRELPHDRQRRLEHRRNRQETQRPQVTSPNTEPTNQKRQTNENHDPPSRPGLYSPSPQLFPRRTPRRPRPQLPFTPRCIKPSRWTASTSSTGRPARPMRPCSCCCTDSPPRRTCSAT